MLHFPHHAAPTASRLLTARHLRPTATSLCPVASALPPPPPSPPPPPGHRLALPCHLYLAPPPPPCRRLALARRIRPDSTSPRPCLPTTTSTSPRHLRPADYPLTPPRHLRLALARASSRPPPRPAHTCRSPPPLDRRRHALALTDRAPLLATAGTAVDPAAVGDRHRGWWRGPFLVPESKFVPLNVDDPMYEPSVILPLLFLTVAATVQEFLKELDGEFLKITKSMPRICIFFGLTGEEMMMFINAFPETGLEPTAFAALVPNSADKILGEISYQQNLFQVAAPQQVMPLIVAFVFLQTDYLWRNVETNATPSSQLLHPCAMDAHPEGTSSSDKSQREKGEERGISRTGEEPADDMDDAPPSPFGALDRDDLEV
ncbi:hypothetical protein GUJ93_ZPchr0012g20258 [Zizania palustris]|uniref:Uncharacterized protein n=1 Tax=Zizania palustris TaxID=103762 RepID=A0A8J5WQ77_ZIZPA|nr:hypothetical protein GUJ93_ZPchr0012g20258 [Zizania palustris]